MKKSIYALLLIHTIVFIISCDKSDKPDMANFPEGVYATTSMTAQQDGCKKLYTRNSAESVQLTASDNNSLKIKHIDSMLNCEPGRITISCQAGEGVISINEKEESTAANCVCPYDLNYSINMPGHGKYTLIINSYEFGEFEFTPQTNTVLYKRL